MPALRQTPVPEEALLARLADDLRAADYSTERLRARWGSRVDAALGRGHAVAARRELAASADPLAVMVRTLGLGDAAPREQVDAAFPRTRAEGLCALGLVTIDADAAVVRPEMLLRPQTFGDAHGVGEWWILSDLDEAALGGAIAQDHVLGVGGASLTLAGLQFSSSAGRVLDLGTGCGIQSLRAVRDSELVVATDVSERALAVTRFTTVLNGVADRVRVVRSDLFGGLSGERFDRVVSNPPFVITPRTEGVPAYEYRDGGQVGDAVVESVVRGLGEHLVPGGTAQLLGNWEYRAGAPGLERVREWVRASDPPLDAWVIERERLDPVAYAELWIRDGGTVPGTADFDRLLDAWLDDFAARGVDEIGFGYILLRRPTAGSPTLGRYEHLLHPVAEGGVGEAWERALAAHDRLQVLSDSALASCALVVSPDVTEARHHLPGSDDPSVIELRQGGGFARTLPVDPALAALVGASDGELTTGQIIGALAQLFEVSEPELFADLMPRVRSLVVDGFLRLPE